MEKMPPREKVVEAWTAIADGRVKIQDDRAEVESSDGAKRYTVRFRGDTFSSDDNATFWRGYAGYPVIAVLMLQGRLPLDMAEADLWKGVNWTVTNKKFRNDYARAVESVAHERDIDMTTANAAIDEVMELLRALPIIIKRKV